jgi:hypothetical protein
MPSFDTEFVFVSDLVALRFKSSSRAKVLFSTGSVGLTTNSGRIDVWAFIRIQCPYHGNRAVTGTERLKLRDCRHGRLLDVQCACHVTGGGDPLQLMYLT